MLDQLHELEIFSKWPGRALIVKQVNSHEAPRGMELVAA